MSMDIGFFDLKHSKLGFANRDQTGGFGSQMDANGLVGNVVCSIKKQHSRLPVLSLAILSSIAKNHGHKIAKQKDRHVNYKHKKYKS